MEKDDECVLDVKVENTKKHKRCQRDAFAKRENNVGCKSYCIVLTLT